MLKAFKTYYSFLWRYKFSFITFIFALLVFSILSNLQPLFLKLFIDNIPKSDLSLLFKIFVFYILSRIFTVVADVVGGIYGDRMLMNASRDVRLEYFKKINDLDFAYHLSKKTGSLISAVKRGDSAFFDMHYVLHWRIVSICISFLIMAFFFSRLNIYLFLSLMVSLLVTVLIGKKLVKVNLHSRKAFLEKDDHIMDVLIDNLNNFDTVKLFAKEKWEHRRLVNLHLDWYKKFYLFTRSFRSIDINIGMIGNFSIFSILIIGLVQFQKGIITIGDYIMVVSFITSFYPRLFELIYETRHLVTATVDLEKYFKVFDEEIKVPDPINPVIKKNIQGKIDFKNISFIYPDNKNHALKNFSLSIKSGESIALVGKSGAGKSTLGKLILHYYNIQKGEILIDDVNINSYTKSNLRSFIGVVPQEPILFNDTIGYNIAYSRPQSSKKEIISATRLANLHDFIMTLPKKYDTVVGERGIRLSGGQRQRLAIARVILANPDIILFDEATSQLDSISEKLIRTSLRNASKNKTTIIIAHRLSTISWVDKIVVIDNGKIVETGTHQELIKNKNSLYNHFWELQSDQVSNEISL
jgi:ATP-binding cassette subfamily B protein